MASHNLSAVLKIQAEVKEYYSELQRLKSSTSSTGDSFQSLAKKGKEAGQALTQMGNSVQRSQSGYSGMAAQIDKVNKSLDEQYKLTSPLYYAHGLE